MLTEPESALGLQNPSTRRPVLKLRPRAAPIALASAPSAPPSARRDSPLERLIKLRRAFPRSVGARDATGSWTPLAIGIHLQIAARSPELAEPRHLLRRALAVHVAQAGYRRAMVAGATRIGLDGNPSGSVTPAEAGHARDRAVTRRNGGANPAAKSQPRPLLLRGPRKIPKTRWSGNIGRCNSVEPAATQRTG